MRRELERLVQKVQIRLGLSLLIHLTGWAVILCGIACFPSLISERLFAYHFLPSWVLWTVVFVTIPCVLCSWFLYYPRPMQAAIQLDNKLGLKERVSTALSLSKSDDAFAQAACREARTVVDKVSLKGHFPVRPGRCWLGAAGIWMFLAVVIFLVPPQDLFGFMKKKQVQEELLVQLQTAEKQVEQSFAQVNTVLKQLGESDLSLEMASPAIAGRPDLPEDVKRDAIKKLDDLSDRLKQMQKEPLMETAANLEQMLSQLKTESMANPLRDVIEAMSKGDYNQAARALEEIQKQLKDGTMTAEQKQALQKAFQNLAKQLNALAAQQKDLEKELEKLGLDKKLSQMDPEQLKKMLEQQGYKPETVEQLMKKVKACQSAGKKCSGLAQAAGMCGSEGSGESMEAMLDELKDLDSFAEMAQINQDALKQINNAKVCLGQGMCNNISGVPGDGIGTGTAGNQLGPHNVDQYDASKMKSTQVQSKAADEMPAIASWYFKDSQEKGQAAREFKEVVQSGRDMAAQAIDENQIPKKYEQAVKQYFGNLETGAKTDSESNASN